MVRQMRDGRRLRGSAKGKVEKKGKDRKEGSLPSWADNARGRGVYVTIFIGGNR